MDNNLKQYATPRQLEVLLAIESEGSEHKAAKKLGITRSSVASAKRAVMRKAAKMGYSPEHGLNHPIPDGYKMRGASTLYNADGQQLLQWIKTTEDSERQAVIFQETIAALTEILPKYEAIEKPKIEFSNLAVVFPVGDAHIGMYAWDEEAGENYDIAIAKQIHIAAIDYLVASVPACKKAIIAVLGDAFHYDGIEAITPAHRNLLDADSRYAKMVRATIKVVRYMIDLCLSKFEDVHISVSIGNHDLSSAIFLSECLFNVYEKEQRLTVDISPSHFKYWRFGKNLLGFHHGHGAKPDQLPQIMAADKAEDWGNTEYRYWMTGHVHHQSVKEFPGVMVESFRVLPPTDAYAANKGYRAGRDMKAIILHEGFGEVARHIFNPKMLVNK